ncbi:MAG: hypothetical protein AB8G22_14345 [Saprospiraceae bacterium]
MKNILRICCYIFLAQFSVSAQELTFSEDLQSLLQRTQIDIPTPLDTDYRSVKVSDRLAKYQSYDYAMRSRKEKLEVRFLLQPLDTLQQFYFPPNANFVRMLTHLASNDDENIIAVHSMSEDDLREEFNADWGQEALFTPKDNFSARTHCKMLMLHKEGVGDVFVFFLFDFPNAAWEKRYHALRFTEVEE